MVGAFLKAVGLAVGLAVALVVASGCQGVREFGPADFACYYGGYCVAAAPDVFGGLDGAAGSDGAGSDAVGGACDVADCDDGNPCTTDSCLAVGGCQHVDNQAPCDDENPCTLKDVCAAGACSSGALAGCTDAFDCTSDGCDPILGCVHTPADSFCDDGKPCTVDTCATVPGTSSGCKHVPAQDGVACKGGACKAGVCAGAKCGDGACDAGESYVTCPADCAASAVCGDGACVQGEDAQNCPQDCKATAVCGNGVCEVGESKASCAKDCECAGDGDCAAVVDPCSTGVCVSGKCVKKAKVGACDDGDPCTANDTCAGGACVGTAKDCSGLNDVCVVGVCQGGACVGKPANNGGKCEDGNLCTLGDVCGGGGCLAGTLKLCNDTDLCTGDSCSPATGVCVFVAIAGCNGNCGAAGDCDDGNPCTDESCVGGKCKSVGNAAGCSDGDACTVGDVCSGGGCKGVAKDCTSLNAPCTVGTCKAGSCSAQAAVDGGACTDGDSCTVSDTCVAGQCVGSPKNCSGLNGICATGVCQAGICTAQVKPGPCNDGDACTVNDECCTVAACGIGACKGVPKDCNDANSCTSDYCELGKCNHQPVVNGNVCSDGKACTKDECQGGICKTFVVACGANATCAEPAGCVCEPGFSGDGATCTSSAPNAVGCGADGVLCGSGKGSCSKGHCMYMDGKGYKWTLVPAGLFWMGCNSAVDGDCQSNESPQHQVDMSAYWIGVYEVTVSNYKACVAAAVPGCSLPGSGPAATYPGYLNNPVNYLTWAAAQSYCKWLGGDLPTEAQWEKAAKGGCDAYPGTDCKTIEPKYPWGNTAPVCGQQAVFSLSAAGCNTDATYVVGKGSISGQSPYGAYDMAGNVTERTLDYWDSAFYSKAGATLKDPVNLTGPSNRTSRGGGFGNPPMLMRASFRAGYNESGPGFGTRCARPFP